MLGQDGFSFLEQALGAPGPDSPEYAEARARCLRAGRDDGIEMIPAEETPQFVGWNQITDLRFARFGGGFELHGPGEQVLLKLSTQLEGLGELLNTILAKGILPKRRVALPYVAEKRYSGALKLLFFVMLALFALPVIGIYQDSGSLAGLILPAVLGLFALAEYLTTPRTITIDRTGITISRVSGSKFLAWEILDGGALAVLRGPKGSVSIGALIRRKDGKWEGLRLQGVDPIELLAAIAASGPDRIIPAPDRLMLSGMNGFGGEYMERKQFAFTLGRPKP